MILIILLSSLALTTWTIKQASGLPNGMNKYMNLDSPSLNTYRTNGRHKRSTTEEHQNIVNVFLSELQNNKNPKEIVFILDRSSAVGSQNFYLQEKKLMYNLIKQYMKVRPSHLNIAIITYGRDITVVEDSISRNTPDFVKCQLTESTSIMDRVQYIRGEESEGGSDIKGALQRAITILGKPKNFGNKQYIILMTSANFKPEDTPSAELARLYQVPIFGVGIGDQITDLKMRELSHYYANFTHWKQKSLTTDYNAAYLQDPDWYSYTDPSCSCGPYSSCYCDVITGNSQCLCDRGYTKSNDHCVACPQGTFKDRIGNHACESCPDIADPQYSTVGGVAYHSSCYCWRAQYNTYASCPDYCRTDPYDPNSNLFCTSARVCNRDTQLSVPKSSHFNCECLPGRAGMFCNTDIPECNALSCLNGGSCIEGYTQYSCLCQWGFTGRLCEKTIDECNNIPDACPERSTCHQREREQYDCICDEGHSSNDCLPSECLYKNCHENKTKENEVLVSKEEGLNSLSKLMLIIIPPAAAALVIITISTAAIIHVYKKAKRREKNVSCATETTSVISRNPSLLTFDSKCYKDEGTPIAPDCQDSNFYDFDDAVYGNEPLQKGMDEWYAYVLELVHNNNLTRVTIVRLDGEKWVLAPGCRLSLTETKALYNILSNMAHSKVVSIQGREFGIVNNENHVIMAHSVGKDGQPHEIACATKTRQFVISGCALFEGDQGACKREIIKLRDHIKEQGL